MVCVVDDKCWSKVFFLFGEVAPNEGVCDETVQGSLVGTFHAVCIVLNNNR